MTQKRSFSSLIAGLSLLFLPVLIPGKAGAQEQGRFSVSLSPSQAWLDSSAPHGYFKLLNRGTTPAEVTVEAGMGVVESGRSGQEGGIVFGGEHPPMKDLTEHIMLFPPKVIIPAGEERFVRYTVPNASLLPDGAYITMVSYRLGERAPVIQGQVPNNSASLNIRYSLVSPIVLIQGGEQPVIGTSPVSMKDGVLTLLLENRGTMPWGGYVVVKSEDGTRIYGQAPSMVYTVRQLDIPLELTPDGPSVRVQFMDREKSIPAHIRRYLPRPEDAVILVPFLPGGGESG